MARRPDWYERLDAIIEVVGNARRLEWLGRNEIQAIFSCSERDSIRLLHKLGAVERVNALTLSRPALLAQLQAIRAGSAYAAFLQQREGVAGQLSAARAETAARHFRVRPAPAQSRPKRLEDLPATIAWRRDGGAGPGRFQILYENGADLMGQLADFLSAAGVNRHEFLAATEPPDDAAR